MFNALKYIKYLIIHKYYVMVECFKRGLYLQGITHDISKILPDEFFPYLDKFYNFKQFPDKSIIYGIKTKETVNNAFNFAWLKHIHRNPHHWQFWILQNDNGSKNCIEIPEKYIKEMIADWIGAGIAITGKNDVINWYEKNKDIIKLNADSKILLEYHLGLRDRFGCKIEV